VSFGLEGGSESLETPLHEMVEGVWEVVFCIFLVYSMLPLRSNWRLFVRHVCGTKVTVLPLSQGGIYDFREYCRKISRFNDVQIEKNSLIPYYHNRLTARKI
jgi:hypothetical protein